MDAGAFVSYAILMAALIGAVVWVAWRLGRRRRVVTPIDRATYETLHTVSVATRYLREGLTPQAAERTARRLRGLLGAEAVALTDTGATLAWEGTGASRHAEAVRRHAEPVLRTGQTLVLADPVIYCPDPDCPIRTAVLAPIVAEDRVVAALGVYGHTTSAGLVRAVEELARWISVQVELAELGRQRTRVMEAELRALRAQISPHFVYNCLATIASFVRTDPDRARELLLEFADFTRYAFRRGGVFTSLQDELRNIERYLDLEQARFGPRLRVQLTIAPEVLPVQVPFLSVQPLVENAVRHGLQRRSGVGHVSIAAADVGAVAEISIEDDGIGSDPDVIRAALAGESSADSIGLGNVDARLRQAYGDEYGLVVETAPSAGTKVTFRVPKYHPRS